MRRSRSPASSYCTASARDSSHWDVWAFRAKLRLKSGMPCLGLEFSMAQTGRLFSRDGYLHQSPQGFVWAPQARKRRHRACKPALIWIELRTIERTQTPTVSAGFLASADPGELRL